jgi:hypothetical protein
MGFFLQEVILLFFIVAISLTPTMVAGNDNVGGTGAQDTLTIQPSCFNFGISKRVDAAIRSFMQEPVSVNTLSNYGYKIGTVDVDNVVSVRKWEFTQLIAFQRLYMVYSGFETGFFSGYIRSKTESGNSLYQYTERTGSNNDLPNAVRKYWWVDSKSGNINPNGNGIVRNRTYDHRARGWYQETKRAGKTIWSSIYEFASTKELGLTHCQPVYDNENKFSGVLAIDYTLGIIDSFLKEEFSTGDRDVFLVEKDTGFLVASSALDPLLRVHDGIQKLTRVPAVNSTNTMIMTVSRFLASRDWPEKLLVVHNGSYIHVTPYKDGNLNWNIVVVMPAASTADIIMPGSGLGVVILSIIILGILINIVS